MNNRDIYIRLLTETHHRYSDAALVRGRIQDLLASLRNMAAREYHLTDEQMQDHCECEANRAIRSREASS